MHHAFNWSPTIGDPTVAGWLTVALYFVAALSCASLALAMHKDKSGSIREFGAWVMIAASFVLLGVNKQLDLQSAFTELGRVLLYRPDRIDYKYDVQVVFIVAVSLLAAICTAAMLALIRNTARGTKIAGFGTLLIIAYVLIRATSFHSIDNFIQSSPAYAVRWNWIIEITGIVVVLVGATMRRITMNRTA